LKVYVRFLVVGGVMMGLAYLLMLYGIEDESLWAEVFAFAVAIAAALLLFRGLAEFLQDVLSGRSRTGRRQEG
jgi:putative exporter of polyketide antibiotics